MKTFEIWAEGWKATGGEGAPHRLGVVKAETFEQACHQLATESVLFAGMFDPKNMTCWGCRLFSTEKEAQKQ